MGNGTEDKAERILTIYTKLKQRKIIYKDALIEKYGVSARTVQRDITDIQEFLQSQFMEEGNEWSRKVAETAIENKAV